MDLGEAWSTPTKKPINYFGDSPHKKVNTNLLDTDIKNEPLDIMDCYLLNDPDVKFEPEYTDKCEQPETKVFADKKNINTPERIAGEEHSITIERNGININNIHENINAENTFGISNVHLNTISSGQVPITRQIVINGQTKTCVVVNNPLLKQNIMERLENASRTISIPPSPNTTTLHSMSILWDNFREHIDSSPPRKLNTSSLKEKATSKPDQNQTVQTIYNPVTGEVITLDSNKTQPSYQNPMANNNDTVLKSQVASDKNVNSNLQNSIHNNVSPPRIYQRFVSSSISPQDNNSNFETSKRNDQSPLSNDQIIQNSYFLSNLPNIDAPSNLSSQNSNRCINQPQLDKPLYANNMDTTLNQIQIISDEIRDMSAALYCNKCNFCSTSLILMDIHMKQHVNSSILTTLKNKITPNAQNIRTPREINIESNNDITSGTIWKNSVSNIVQDGLIGNTQNTNITGHVEEVLHSVGSRNRSVLKKTHKEKSAINDVHLTDNGSLLTNTTEQNPSERVTEDNQFQGVDTNVKGTKISKSLIRACNNSNTANVDRPISGQYDIESLVPKSACERELAENTVVAPSSPPRSMRTRSKSLGINKSDFLPLPIFSPTRTRRKSLCAEKFVSEQKAMDFKLSQNVPRSGGNLQDDKDNDQKIGNSKHFNALEISSNNSARKNSALERSRSDSIAEENCNSQSFPKSVDSSVTNRPNLISNNNTNSNSVCETGNSNCQSDSEIIVTSDNDEEYSSYSYNNLLLLQDNTFSCSICSFTTDKKRTLSDHERNHRKTKQPIFRCVYCNQRYTRYMLYLHIQNVHPGQKFQVCEAEVKKTSNKNIHKCSVCLFSTTDQEELVLHMKEHPAETVVTKDASDTVKDYSNPLFICFACSFKTSEQKQIHLHLTNHAFKPVKRIDSLGASIFSCEFCSYNNKSVSKAIQHMSSHKNNRQIRNCPHCDFKSTPTSLFYHIQRCTTTSKSTKELNISNPVFDAQNGQSSTNESGARMAKSKMSSIKLAKYNLNMLFKPFTRFDDCGRQLFDCKICSYGCSSFKDIVIHINSHKKNLPIMKCPNCNFKSTGWALRSHKRKCKNSTILDCQNSKNKSVTGQFKPKISMLARSNHTLFKPVTRLDCGRQMFACKMCSYECPSFRDIVMHINSHKKNLPIMKCSNCNFKSTGCALRFHKQKCKNSIISDCQNSENKSVTGQLKPEISMLAKSKHTLFKPVTRLDDCGRQMFGCKMCSYECRSFRNIVMHINSHKKNLPIVKCPNCNFKSTDRPLKFHMQNCKPGAVQVKMLSKSNIHINSHKKNIQIIKSPNGPFKSTTRVAKRHMQTCKNSTSAKGQNNDYNSLDIGQLKPEISILANSNLYTPAKRVVDSGRPVFECKMCSYWCRRSRDLIAHIKYHKKNMPIIKCPNCTFKSTARAAKRHMKTCKKSIFAEGQNNGYKSSTGQVNPEMTKAKLAKLDIRSLYKPVKRINESGGTMFDCKMCSYKCPRIKAFVGHINSHKKKLPIIKCPNCSFKSTAFALKSHMQKCNKTSAVPCSNNKSDPKKDKINQKCLVAVKTKPKSLFKCTKCSFFTSLRIKLKLHIRKRHLKIPQPVIKSVVPQEFHCRCSFSTNLRLKLNLHQKSCLAAKEQKFTCNLCSFVTVNKGCYQLHRKCHAKHLPIKKCPQCTFKSTSYALKSHMKKSGHDTDKEAYKCALCSFSSILQSDYFGHIKKHENDRKNEKPFSVSDNANSKAAVVANAREEDEKNTGTTNSDNKKLIFQCPQCPYSTGLRIKLNYHTKKRHQQIFTEHFTKVDQSYQCNYCSYVSKRLGNCKSHTSTHLKYKLPIKKCQNCNYKSTFYALRSHSFDCKGDQINKTELNYNIVGAKTDLLFDKQSSSARAVEKDSVASSTEDISLGKSKTLQKIDEKACTVDTTKPEQKENTDKTCQVDLLTPVIDSSVQNISKILSCKLCSYTTRISHHLLRHTKTHPTRPILKCIHCSYRSTPQALSLHLSKCSDRMSKNNDEVSKVSLKHPEQNTELSPEQTTNDNSLKSFKCQYCSFTSFWSYLIDRHMDSHTLLKLPVTQCGKCDFKSTPAALLAHANACTRKALTDDPGKVNKSRKRVREFKARDNPQFNKLRKRKDNSNSEVQGQSIAHSSDMSKCKDRNVIPKMYVNNKLNKDSTKNTSTVSEKLSSIGISVKTPSLDGKPSAVFKCPKCSFSTHLRIKLNFHLRKCPGYK